MLDIFKFDYNFKNNKIQINLYFKPENLSSKLNKEVNDLFFKTNINISLLPFKNDYRFLLEFEYYEDEKELLKTLFKMINSTNDLVVYSCYEDKIISTWAIAWIKYFKLKTK